MLQLESSVEHADVDQVERSRRRARRTCVRCGSGSYSPGVSLDDEARDELEALALAHRLRTPRVLDGAQGPVITLDGNRVINFASNDYLGLAADARLIVRDFVIERASSFGVGDD